jgi:YVTN family beta-propeller protein
MGDAAFGTDPVPYAFPNGTPATNNGDNIHIVTQDQTTHLWSLNGELDLGQVAPPLNGNPAQTVAEGHPSGNGLPVPNSGFASVNAAVYVAPMAAGVAISKDGQTLAVANYYNDSITVFTGGLQVWTSQWLPDAGSLQQGKGTLQGNELDLRPGNGVAGGEYPFWVVLTGTGSSTTAYISSLRDREIDVVNLHESCNSATPVVCTVAPAVSARIPVKGQPNKMTANQAGTLLYVAEDDSDTVDVINLVTNAVVESIPVIAPASVLQSFSLTQYRGANTNSVTLSPDETHLYVTNGNLNNIAVVSLGGTNSGD